MITRIIELCARNRAMVFLAVAFALIGAAWSIQRVKLDAIPDVCTIGVSKDVCERRRCIADI